MNPARRVLLFSLFLSIGVWGCARGPAKKRAQAERVKLLEARCAKLEDDYRTVATTRDRLRRQMTTLHQQRAELEQQIDAKNIELDSKAKRLHAVLHEENQWEGEIRALKKQLEEAEAHRLECLARVRKEMQKQITTANQDHEKTLERCQKLKRGLQELIGQDDEIYSTKTSTKALPIMSFVED